MVEARKTIFTSTIHSRELIYFLFNCPKMNVLKAFKLLLSDRTPFKLLIQLR